jgi:hypothetical protein
MISTAHLDVVLTEHHGRVERANDKGWLVQSVRDADAAASETRRDAITRTVTGFAAGLVGIVGVFVAAVVR